MQLDYNKTSQKLLISRGFSLALYAALILAYCIWQILFRPGGPSYFFWLIQLLPLLLVLPGIKANYPRSYIWLCFLLLMYFVKGVDGVISPSRAWIDYFVVGISILLFISAMLTSRWLQQYFFEKTEA